MYNTNINNTSVMRQIRGNFQWKLECTTKLNCYGFFLIIIGNFNFVQFKMNSYAQ